MQYKIFGSDRTPYPGFRDQLRAFLNLDEAQEDAVANAFLQKALDNFGRPKPQVVAESSILPEQFREAAELAYQLLYAWKEYDLQLADVEGDLLLLGCNEGEIKTIIAFLEKLRNVRDSVWAKNYSRFQQLDGLPTIDDVNILCDARAVFGGFPEASEKVGGAYKTLLGLKPIVIMEIISSDNYGRQQRTAFQLNEEDFEGFQRVISRAREQLAILKERIEALLPSD